METEVDRMNIRNKKAEEDAIILKEMYDGKHGKTLQVLADILINNDGLTILKARTLINTKGK